MNFTLQPKAIQTAVAKLKFRTQAFIDGKFCPSKSGKTYASINPANGATLQTFPEATAAGIETEPCASGRLF